MANRSLYRHALNWVHTPLALQDTGTLHTTWRYSDLIAVALFSSLFHELYRYSVHLFS